MLAAMLNIVRIDVIFTTGANISLKSTPFFYWKSFMTIRALYLGGFPPSPGFNLYTHLFRSAFFPLGSSVSSYVWFSCKESISSCMALNHFRLWVSSLASSKLSGSPSHRLTVHALHPEIFGGPSFLLGGIFGLHSAQSVLLRLLRLSQIWFLV